MSMIAQRRRHPRNKGSFRAVPYGAELAYLGDFAEDWVIRGVPDDATPLEVLSGAANLPQPGDEHEKHPGWIAGHVDLNDTAATDPRTDENAWFATVAWLPSPLWLPTEVHYFGNRVMKVVDKDLDTGALIRNSANDPFNPPIQEPQAVARVRVVKRYSVDAWQQFRINDYMEHLNETDFDIPAFGVMVARQVYCTNLEAPLVQEPIWHHQASFDLEILVDDVWMPHILDSGSQYIETSTGKKVLFSDERGVTHGGIGLLDGSGGKGDPDHPSYLDFSTKPVADFNDFGLF
jgi:hypothetical protein